METLAELIDKLIVVNIKIFHCIEIVESSTDNDVVAETSRKTASLNRQRSSIMNEISERLGEKDMRVKL